MNSDSGKPNVNPTHRLGERPIRRRSSPYTDILNSPAMQLQRSLAAQHALLRSVPTIPDFSAALTPPTLGFFQDVQRLLVVQNTIRSELADTAFALRTAHNRILAEVQAVAAARDALQKSFRHAIEAASMLRQVVSGNVLSEMRSMLAARESFAFQVRSHLQAVTEASKLVTGDVLSGIRAAMEARAAISEQLQEALQSASALRTQAMPTMQVLVDRLNILRLDELGRVAEELAARDALFAAWSAEGTASLTTQLEADLAIHPEAAEWSIEEKVNYLIEWTQRQDDALVKQIMIALIINLVAAVIFWMSVEVIPNVMSDKDEVRPQAIIRDVRERVQEQPLASPDVAQLRIVSRRKAPVRNSCRRRSRRVAVLHAGTLVRACEKRRKWVFVEWTDLESGRSFETWMLSKHLVPLEKKIRSAYRR